jgi:hypothetical protein
VSQSPLGRCLAFPVSHDGAASRRDMTRRRATSARLVAGTAGTVAPAGRVARVRLQGCPVQRTTDVRGSSLRRLRPAVVPLLSVAVERHPQHRSDWMPGGYARGFEDQRDGPVLNISGVAR